MLKPPAAPKRPLTARRVPTRGVSVPPPTKFNPSQVQAKSATALTRGAKPPPTKFAYGGVQAKPAPATARTVPPPPTKFAPRTQQAKGAPSAQRRIAPPPTRFAPVIRQAKPASPFIRTTAPPVAFRAATAARGVVQKMDVDDIDVDDIDVDDVGMDVDTPLTPAEIEELAAEEARQKQWHDDPDNKLFGMGWTDHSKVVSPYLQSEHEVRQFGLLHFPFHVVLHKKDGVPLAPTYTAEEVCVSRLVASRDRMYTGHKEKTKPQGHHLFSFEALISSIERYRGTVKGLLTLIGDFLNDYKALPSQTAPAQVLLNHAPETITAMVDFACDIATWQNFVGNALQSYVQVQQYSVHATSGYGSGANNEGHHKSELRKIETQMWNGEMDENAGADAAKEHIEALFDLHGNVAVEYRTQSLREGLRWLKYFAPKAIAAYSKKYSDFKGISTGV
jgi:hypothetical protein